MLALVLLVEDDLRQNLTRDILAGARIAHLEFDAFLHHLAEMVERDVARRMRVVEAPVRVFFYDDRTGRPALCLVQAGSSIACDGAFPVHFLKLTQHP